MSECIFCKIAQHDIQSDCVYEDDKVIAFKDLNPQAPIHILVIPKKHFNNIVDNVESDILAAMVNAISHIAKELGFEKSGFRVITNTGEAAGQSVMHLHMHVLAGSKLGEGLLPKA